MAENSADNNESRQQQSMDQLAQQALNEIIAKYTAQWEAAATENNPEEQKRMRDQIAKAAKDEIDSKIKKVKGEVAEEAEGEPKSEDIKENAKEAKKTFLEVSEMKKHGVEVLDKSSQSLADSIAEQIKAGKLSDQEAVDIINAIGKQLVDGVVFSKGDQQRSDFEKNLETLRDTNKSAYQKIRKEIRDHHDQYGLDNEEVRDKFGGGGRDNETAPQENESDDGELRRQLEDQERRRRDDPEWSREVQFEQQDKHLYARFTAEDQEFLKQFYKASTFEKLVERSVSDMASHEAQHGQHIRHSIENVYREMGERVPTGAEMDALVEKQVRIEAGEGIAKRMTDIMNKLYWRVHNERPHKFFEEIEKEDFMTGIEATKLRISNALESLQHTLEDMEKRGKATTDIRLYKNAEREYYIDERQVVKEGQKYTKPYMRVSPLPEFTDISLSQYVKSLIKNLDHWRHRSEYLHNARAIFNHPAHGDKGFFSNLGGYAENLGGTDIDEMMLLPDGRLVFDAYMLYDKLVEEEFASQDWKHRPNQFTNSLEEVNTQVEKEVIARLKLMYKGLESDDAIQSAVNAAVGMGRGVFLTETEKSAYADAVDPTGGGMFASYATNDATALQTFNPLHVMLRWQGEHMMPMFYFMDTKGSGNFWNHTKTWGESKKFFDSFLKGRKGLDGKTLFIDQLIDNMNVGGVLKRRGWRTTYALEGHNVYEQITLPDGTKRNTNSLNHLETFKAMDVIGYEALYDFLMTKLDKGILKARPGSAGAGKMDTLFTYIFDRYFKPFGGTDYKAYMNGLRAEGAKRAEGELKKKGFYPNGSFEEEVNVQTGLVFLENTLAREVALRFPSKFLRMDRDRFSENGISRYTQVQRDLNMSRDEFNVVMRDFGFAELLIRREISDYAKQSNQLFPEHGLNDFNKFNFIVNADSIQRVLRSHGVDEARVSKVVAVWDRMNKLYLSDKGFMDAKAYADIKKYTFTFGIEDTDFTLMAMRATGPRMIARSINDVGQMESITPWIINMPRLLNQIATSGKRDFMPVIEYLQKAQNAYTSVHGTGADFQYIYKIAAATIQYFKRDTVAKPLFGLFGLGRKNSIAAEYAGRSSAVWEWDARDIDRFVTTLETARLLPKDAFNLERPPVYKDRYVKLPFLKTAIKLGKVRVNDYDWTASKLRQEFGADFKAIAAEMVDTIIPLLMAAVLYHFIKKALEEAEGKKK